MKLFSYHDRELVLLCWAFNRGHAAKQIAKYCEERGQEFRLSSALEEVPGEEKKGRIITLRPWDFV